MDRRSQILRHITKTQRGIEVAPWFAPLTPKRDGYDCRIIDVFDKPTLLKRAQDDSAIPVSGHALLEDVDFVGSATMIAELVPVANHGAFDYIVSSHNFEHLPDPIRFLQGCQKVLRPGGYLSMAVPDCRACFDFFRPHTTLIEWLEAHADQRSQPTRAQVFAMTANQSALVREGKQLGAFALDADATAVTCTGDLDATYAAWRATKPNADYQDTHCSVMTPASFELLIRECQHLGLLTFEIESISAPNGCEFYVHLVNRPNAPPAAIGKSTFQVDRTQLMHRIWNERATASETGQRHVRWIRRLLAWLQSSERRTRHAIKRRWRGGAADKSGAKPKSS